MSKITDPVPLRGGAFASLLLAWQKRHGRQHLPWQNTGSAYCVWLSEVMLQQTQVSTVIGYYTRFLNVFPTVADLATAPQEAVMTLWAGLGYYSRARNLHACAQQVLAHFGGEFPRDVALLESLPGIGRSTAGAIASLGYGVQAPILDGNVKRVFCRYYGVDGYPEKSVVRKELWAIADQNVPAQDPGRYNQALMDLGATLCLPKNPHCSQCPLMAQCQALKQGKTALLPSPKPKKPRPDVYFLAVLLRNAEGKIALGVQQQKGIWQQLWMLPNMALGSAQAVSAMDFPAVLQGCGLGQLALKDAEKEALQQCLENLPAQPWLVHELTHRKMHFKVLVVQVNCAPEGWGLYLPTEKPLPRLVHKIIEVFAPVG